MVVRSSHRGGVGTWYLDDHILGHRAAGLGIYRGLLRTGNASNCP